MNAYPKRNQKAIAFSLFELCNAKSTGTLFIKTHENDTALFTLNNGEITDLTFGLKRGLVAISALKNEIYKKIEFIDDHLEPMAQDSKVTCSQTLLTHLGYDQHMASYTPKKVICYLEA